MYTPPVPPANILLVVYNLNIFYIISFIGHTEKLEPRLDTRVQLLAFVHVSLHV